MGQPVEHLLTLLADEPVEEAKEHRLPMKHDFALLVDDDVAEVMPMEKADGKRFVEMNLSFLGEETSKME